MSGVASIHRGKQKHPAEPATAPIWVNPTGNAPTIIPAGNATGTAYEIPLALQTGGQAYAQGFAALASGVATVNTGLSTVNSFQTTMVATGFSTGATEVTSVVVSGATGPIATGAVPVIGFRLFTTTASASGTGIFYWVAFGTK